MITSLPKGSSRAVIDLYQAERSSHTQNQSSLNRGENWPNLLSHRKYIPLDYIFGFPKILYEAKKVVDRLYRLDELVNTNDMAFFTYLDKNINNWEGKNHNYHGSNLDTANFTAFQVVTCYVDGSAYSSFTCRGIHIQSFIIQVILVESH